MIWLPIETAPKDGSWVLLCGGREYAEESVGPCVVAFWDGAYWLYCYWDSAWRSAYENATHWMPIPELPKPEGRL